MRAWVIAAVVVVVLAVAVLLLARTGNDEDPAQRSVAVARGTVERTAVAAGRIEPAYEITVRSPLGGLLGERLARLGDRVAVGDPLVEVRQEVNKLALIQARRSVEIAERGEEAASEYVQGRHLASYLMRLVFGRRELERMGEDARLGRRRAEESLEFLKSGKLMIGGEEVDTVVRAPVEGHVIELASSPGQRVIPVGAYQPATELATIADMDNLEFRGTVDEIDVGKLEQGMSAEIRVGALPGLTLKGTVEEVGLKARNVSNATVFDVRMTIDGHEGQVMRAGYSATAEIFIEKRADVLVVPERVVEFRDGEAIARLAGPDGSPVERKIELGLSDGLLVEVVEGLREGERVLERQYPRIK